MMSSMGMGAMPGSAQPMAMPGMQPAAQMCMVPRCEMKFEKCNGGMKIHCKCDDDVAAATLQHMCKMLAGSLCSCSCMMNGMMICQCCMSMCNCECTSTKDGVCISCTSGDKHCAAMCQACCECMNECMEAGCMCCVSLGGMPVCCCC